MEFRLSNLRRSGFLYTYQVHFSMSYTPTEFDNIERSPKGEAGGGITSPPASEGMTPEEFARHKKVLMGINSAFGFVLVIMWFTGVGLSSFLSYFIALFKKKSSFETNLYFFIIILNLLFILLLYISAWRQMELESPIRYMYSFLIFYLILILKNFDTRKNSY